MSVAEVVATAKVARRARRGVARIVALIGLVAGPAMAASCAAEPVVAPPDVGALPEDPFAESDCFACVALACEARITVCLADPECAHAFECLEACPTNDAGAADAGCREGCGAPASAVGAERFAALASCIDTGPARNCYGCGADLGWITSQTCGPSSEPSQCFRCIDERCCETYAACATSPACNAYEACWKDCVGIQGSQAGCEVACAQTFPDGATLFAPYFACAMVECAAEQIDCDEASRTTCEACLYESCAAAYVALMVDPYGYQLVHCVEDCPLGDSACDGGCYDAFPTALPAWQAYAACVATTCTSC